MPIILQGSARSATASAASHASAAPTASAETVTGCVIANRVKKCVNFFNISNCALIAGPSGRCVYAIGKENDRLSSLNLLEFAGEDLVYGFIEACAVAEFGLVDRVS